MSPEIHPLSPASPQSGLFIPLLCFKSMGITTSAWSGRMGSQEHLSLSQHLSHPNITHLQMFQSLPAVDHVNPIHLRFLSNKTWNQEMLFSFYVLYSCLSLQQKEETTSGQEQNHKNLAWSREVNILSSFSPIPPVGNPESFVLFVFKACPEKKTPSFPVCLIQYEWRAFHPALVFFINSQFLDAFISQVHWGHIAPLASITKTHGFLGSFCLELFSTDIKGPLSSSEGCDRCQNPHKPSPWRMLLPAGPYSH